MSLLKCLPLRGSRSEARSKKEKKMLSPRPVLLSEVTTQIMEYNAAVENFRDEEYPNMKQGT